MSKKTYEALPGVAWVNGQPVPENREMKLSAAEAEFDLVQGRIRMKGEEAGAEKPVDVLADDLSAVMPEAETRRKR